MSLASSRRDAFRGMWLMVLLVAGLILAAVLPWQAVRLMLIFGRILQPVW